MKTFSQLKVTPSVKPFSGDKIKMGKVLNKEIIIHDYRIVDSKYDSTKGNGKCLHLSIGIGEIKHLIFTGSVVLQELIQQISKDDFPFTTTIVEENERFEFT